MNPNRLISEEVLRHIGDEFIIGEDWNARFTINAANMRALGDEIRGSNDPDTLLHLIELRNGTLVSTLGSGVLAVYKNTLTAERVHFESEFGAY